jgi:hypothetical protein
LLNGKTKGFLYQVVQCVATLLDAWPDSPGITGRDRVESVAGIKWNHRPGSCGIRGRDRLEFAETVDHLRESLVLQASKALESTRTLSFVLKKMENRIIDGRRLLHQADKHGNRGMFCVI